MSEFVKEVSDSNFETEVLNSAVPTLVDFWAPWCAPCRMIAPSVEAVAKENGSLVQVVKMNVDDNPAISQRFGIKGIPTLIVFKDGREVERMVGAGSKEALSKLVERHVAKAA
jgi:thioredoxin 1